jgi:hypothetical protein
MEKNIGNYRLDSFPNSLQAAKTTVLIVVLFGGGFKQITMFIGLMDGWLMLVQMSGCVTQKEKEKTCSIRHLQQSMKFNPS